MARSFYDIIVKLEGDKEVNSGLQSIGVQAGLATAALTALATKAAMAAIEYDSAIAKFNTIASEATGTIKQQEKAFSDLTDSLKNSVTAAQALNAGYEVLSSGYSDLNDVTGILTASQKAAVGGFSDIKTVADAATTVLNVYGDSYGNAVTVTEKANDVLSQAIAVQNLGKITVDQYARSIGVLVPTAKAANVGLSELNAAIALATSRGIAADTAIRGYRQLLVNLIRPTAQATAAAKANGIEIGNQALQTKGYNAVLQDIVNTAKSNPNIISEIFTDVDSLNIANVLIGNSEALAKFNREIEIAREKNILETQFQIVSESDAAKQQRLLNLINESFVDLGQGVVNSLEPIIELVSEALKLFKNAPDSFKQLIGGLAVIITAFGGFTTSVLAGRFAILSFQDALKAVGITAKASVASLGAFAAAAIVLSETINTFQAINGAASSTEQGIARVKDALEEFNNSLADNGSAAEEFDAIQFAIQRTNETVAESISPIGKFFDFIITGLNNAGEAFNNFIDKLPLVPQAIKNVLKDNVINDFFELIPRDEEGKILTREKAAANRIATAVNESIVQSIKTREKFQFIDPNEIELDDLRKGLKTLQTQKDALKATRFTNPEDAARINEEVAAIEKELERFGEVASARGLEIRSEVELTKAQNERKQKAEELTDALKKQEESSKALLNTELKQIDALKARGEISEVEAIERTLAAEEKAAKERIALIRSTLDEKVLTTKETEELEKELAKLTEDLEANTAERVAQINRSKLDTIANLRERDIARVQASGKTEIEIAREVSKIKSESAAKEIEEIQEQIEATKEGSQLRIELETRLFKLQADVAKSKADLAKQEKAAIDELIKKKTEEIELEARLIKAQAGDDSVKKAEAELKALDGKIEALKEIAKTEGLSAETVKKLTVEIAEAEAERVTINKRIASEIANRQVSAIKEVLALQEQSLDFEKQAIDATSDFISAQNSLISTISSGLSSIVSPLEALEGAYEKVGQASQRVADIDKARQDQLRDRSLQDIRVPTGASEAQKAAIEAENKRRAAIRERIALQREEEQFQRQRAEALKAEKKAKEEAAKAEQEALVANRQRAILEEQLSQLGIRINRTGDVANDIKEAQIQLQILEITNQQRLNLLKVEQQQLELKNLQLQQQAIIAEENLRIESGLLNETELQQARLRLQLAQNQLNVTKQQAANIERQANLTDRGFALQQRLAQAQLRNPIQAEDLRGAQRAALSEVRNQSEIINKPVVEALQRIGTLESVNNAITRLENVSGGILNGINQLPNSLARVIPKPVVPR
jgi:TP901 family phage tail tape measure protein